MLPISVVEMAVTPFSTDSRRVSCWVFFISTASMRGARPPDAASASAAESAAAVALPTASPALIFASCALDCAAVDCALASLALAAAASRLA